MRSLIATRLSLLPGPSLSGRGALRLVPAGGPQAVPCTRDGADRAEPHAHLTGPTA